MKINGEGDGQTGEWTVFLYPPSTFIDGDNKKLPAKCPRFIQYNAGHCKLPNLKDTLSNCIKVSQNYKRTCTLENHIIKIHYNGSHEYTVKLNTYLLIINN